MIESYFVKFAFFTNNPKGKRRKNQFDSLHGWGNQIDFSNLTK